MANVSVDIIYDTTGEDKVAKSAARIKNEIKSTAAATGTLADRMQAFGKNNFQLLLAADAARGLAGQLVSAAKGIYEFAKAGAATSAVAREFAVIDDKLTSSQKRLQEIAAESLIKSGALDVATTSADSLEGAMEGIGSVVGALAPVFDVMNITFNKMGTELKIVGSVVGALADAFIFLYDNSIGLLMDGIGILTDTVGDFASSLLSASESSWSMSDGINAIVRAYDTGYLNQKLEETARLMDEAFSNKATSADIENITKTLENLTKNGADQADIQVIISDQVRKVSKDMAEYEENLKRVRDAVVSKKKDDLESVSIAYKMADSLLSIAESTKTTAIEFEQAKEPMINFSAVASAMTSIINTGTVGFASWIKDVEKTSSRMNRLSRDSGEYLEKLADATERMAAPIRYLANSSDVERAMAVVDEILEKSKIGTNMSFTENVAAYFGRKKTDIELSIQAIRNGLDSITDTNQDLLVAQMTMNEVTDAVISYGNALSGLPELAGLVAGSSMDFAWIEAVMGAMLSAADAARAFGIGNIPGGIASSIAAAKYIAAQAFAESKGAKGSKPAAAAIAASATRPPSELDRGGRIGTSNITLNVDGRRLGEESILGANKARRFGSARLDPSIIASPGWRGRI